MRQTAPHPSSETGPTSGVQPSCRSLNDPPVRLLLRPMPYMRKPRKRTSALSQKPGTATRGTISRSILTSPRRASRARWSSSTLGTLLLQRFGLAMASSTAWCSEANTDAVTFHILPAVRPGVSGITSRGLFSGVGLIRTSAPQRPSFPPHARSGFFAQEHSSWVRLLRRSRKGDTIAIADRAFGECRSRGAL